VLTLAVYGAVNCAASTTVVGVLPDSFTLPAVDVHGNVIRTSLGECGIVVAVEGMETMDVNTLRVREGGNVMLFTEREPAVAEGEFPFLGELLDRISAGGWRVRALAKRVETSERALIIATISRREPLIRERSE